MTTKKQTKQTKEEQALALTPDGIFRAFESVVPKGATVENVLNAAATLIASSLVQMNASKQDLHNIMVHLEEWVLTKVELKEATDNKEE